MRKDERGIFLVMGFWLIQCCWSLGAAQTGCATWKPHGDNDVCCQLCKPGYRIFRRCSPNITDLCVPCESGTFSLDPSTSSCTTCKQCGGVQVQVAACTKTKNTVCGCSNGFWCKDSYCSTCVKECEIGQQPADGTCRRCPHGTFNDQNHQKCKPWKSKCPHPDEYMIKGDAYTDSKCIANTTTTTMKTTTQRNGERPTVEDPMLSEAWWLVILFSCIVTALVVLIIIINVVKKLTEKKKKGKPKTTAQKELFITTPTDEPRTLMAIECSFHEPEQVSSSESLAMENPDGSTQKLIV